MQETDKEKMDAALNAFIANQERLKKAAGAAAEAARKVAEEKAKSEQAKS